ncbi:MAG: hypothetical protein MUE61_11630 [Vicinamibacterales bacterium]|nr:hypothetical protein [Vicinamibacterales bacterium]
MLIARVATRPRTSYIYAIVSVGSGPSTLATCPAPRPPAGWYVYAVVPVPSVIDVTRGYTGSYA